MSSPAGAGSAMDTPVVSEDAGDAAPDPISIGFARTIVENNIVAGDVDEETTLVTTGGLIGAIAEIVAVASARSADSALRPAPIDHQQGQEGLSLGELRIGKHYGIHVYEGERSVATFHRADEAEAVVAAWNRRSAPPSPSPVKLPEGMRLVPVKPTEAIIEWLTTAIRRGAWGRENIIKQWGWLLSGASAAPVLEPAPEAVDAEMREPEACYDPEEGEYSFLWEDRNCLFDDYPHGEPSEPKHIATSFKGPDKWAVSVPISWDGNGPDAEPDDWEIQWFDSEAEAIAARAEAALPQEPRP